MGLRTRFVNGHVNVLRSINGSVLVVGPCLVLSRGVRFSEGAALNDFRITRRRNGFHVCLETLARVFLRGPTVGLRVN